jgi:hypothetical protein
MSNQLTEKQIQELISKIQVIDNGELAEAASVLCMPESVTLDKQRYRPEGWSKKAWAILCGMPYTLRLKTASILIEMELKRITKTDK